MKSKVEITTTIYNHGIKTYAITDVGDNPSILSFNELNVDILWYKDGVSNVVSISRNRIGKNFFKFFLALRVDCDKVTIYDIPRSIARDRYLVLKSSYYKGISFTDMGIFYYPFDGCSFLIKHDDKLSRKSLKVRRLFKQDVTMKSYERRTPLRMERVNVIV